MTFPLPYLSVHFLHHIVLKLIEDPEIRPGLCPAPFLNECESGLGERFRGECLLDKECDVGEKCCADGCNLVCMAVEIQEKEYVVLFSLKYQKQLHSKSVSNAGFLQ